MSYLDKIKPGNIQALDVFLEKRKARWHVGTLCYSKDGERFVFEYSDKYIYSKSSIAIGPDIPLTRKKHRSESLFKSFNDRIPSSKNPSYVEYCAQAEISPNETNQIILLATIGRRGPSSFVFEPIYKETVSDEALVAFRKNLNLTVREFSSVFDFSTSTINKIEKQQDKNRGSEAAKRLTILLEFPDVSIYALKKKGGALHQDKKLAAIQYLEQLSKK